MNVVGRGRRALDQAAKKIFPDHWSYLLGEVAMVALFVLFATGIVLALFYDASGDRTTYHGAYPPMQGVEMSRAYESVLQLSFDVPAGLLLRQVHHWAALVFVGAIVVHALRVFFTGAYRRPRRVNYLVGLTLLILAITNGFFGVALPDDLLSGSGAQIGYSIALSVPVLGTGIASALFAGEFPSQEMVHRFWLLHVFVIPTLIVALFSLHMVLVWRQTHTQYPSEGPADEVVGSRLLPHHALKTAALLGSMTAVLVGMGAFLQINPVWVHGPFQAAAATVPAGPDWYLMFVEGGLRILPALHLVLGPVEIPSPFLAGIVVPALVFGTLAAWPFAEERLTGDRHVHHLLERPRDRPGRTAFGVAGLSFLAVLTLAANHDYLGGVLGIDVVAMTTAFRVLVVAAPVVLGTVAWRLARDLADADPAPDRSPAARREAR
ncbi:MAG: cytochrome bc complex cytochrome b subunit [Actinomycetota bacterium]|nr:cytochrome bc complex cytochrome b subunit [Actinomycetota bacterium]